MKTLQDATREPAFQQASPLVGRPRPLPHHLLAFVAVLAVCVCGQLLAAVSTPALDPLSAGRALFKARKFKEAISFLDAALRQEANHSDRRALLPRSVL